MVKINIERVLKFSIVLLIIILLIGYYKPEIKLNSNKNVLNTSQLTGKIRITGNGGWIDFRNAGYCTGSGTSLDPYVIQDLNINGIGHDESILIEESDVYFIIEDCTIYNAGQAVSFINVQNGIIKDNLIVQNIDGIRLYQCSYNSIIDNVISNNNDNDISLFQSNNIDILRNTITSGERGITLDKSQNSIISQNTVENTIYGITISRNINNQITNNILRNNEFGLYIIESSCNTITGNSFSGNGEDIHGEQDICSTFINYLSVGILLGILGISGISGITITYFLIKRKKKISRKRELKGLVYLRTEQTQAPQKLVSEEIIEPQTIPRLIEVIEPPPAVNLEASLISNEILATGEQKEESLAKEEFIEEKSILESEDRSKEEEIVDKKVIHYCINCGKPLIDTWKICAYCGVKIRKDLWKPEPVVEKEKVLIEKELEIPAVGFQKYFDIEEIKQEIIEEPKAPDISKTIKRELEKPIVESQKSPKIEEIKQEFIEEPKAPDISKTIEKEPVKPKILKNICPFCGLENPLEQLRCKQCGYKLKRIV